MCGDRGPIRGHKAQLPAWEACLGLEACGPKGTGEIGKWAQGIDTPGNSGTSSPLAASASIARRASTSALSDGVTALGFAAPHATQQGQAAGPSPSGPSPAGPSAAAEGGLYNVQLRAEEIESFLLARGAQLAVHIDTTVPLSTAPPAPLPAWHGYQPWGGAMLPAVPSPMMQQPQAWQAHFAPAPAVPQQAQCGPASSPAAAAAPLPKAEAPKVGAAGGKRAAERDDDAGSSDEEDEEEEGAGVEDAAAGAKGGKPSSTVYSERVKKRRRESARRSRVRKNAYVSCLEQDNLRLKNEVAMLQAAVASAGLLPHIDCGGLMAQPQAPQMAPVAMMQACGLPMGGACGGGGALAASAPAPPLTFDLSFLHDDVIDSFGLGLF